MGTTLGDAFRSCQKKVDLFNEDLTQFTSCYNLSDILSLIHSFENRDDLKGVLGENTDPRAIPLLEEKLILRPLDSDHERGGLASAFTAVKGNSKTPETFNGPGLPDPLFGNQKI